MEIVVSEQDKLMVVAVRGRLDTLGAAELEKWVAEHLSPPESNVSMDFSAMDYISSAGLRVMLNLSKLLQSHGLGFSISLAQDHVVEVLEISGFDSFIPLYDSLEEAVAAL